MTEIKDNIIDAEIENENKQESTETNTPLAIAKVVGRFGCAFGTSRIVKSFCNTYGKRPGDGVLANVGIGITSWFLSDAVCDRVVETMDHKLDEMAKTIVDFKEAVARASKESTD